MADEFNYDFGYGGTDDVSIGDTSGYNYDFGYGGAGDVSVGNTGTPGTYAPTTVSASSPDFLSRLFSGSMTSGDKAGAMLGLGALAIAQSLANKPPTIKQPVYKQAPVYNRALTAPMYGLGYLNPQTGKQIGMGMPLFFNPNPFQFDPTEAAKRYGPTPAEIAAGEQVYSQKMAELYTPRTVPDVQMTGQTGTAQPATQQATTTVPFSSSDTVSTIPSPVPYIYDKKPLEKAVPFSSSDTVSTIPSPVLYIYDKKPLEKAVPASSPTGKVDNTMPVTDVGSLVGMPEGYTPPQGPPTMAGGGFLKGRGDGMSDEINATINEKQPARLSDGEFVIPADVVAHLGNGSSKAGANKLYEMMARIRKARTGTAKQAPKINPNKFV